MMTIGSQLMRINGKITATNLKSKTSSRWTICKSCSRDSRRQKKRVGIRLIRSVRSSMNLTLIWSSFRHQRMQRRPAWATMEACLRPTTRRAMVVLRMPLQVQVGQVSEPRNRHLRALALQREARCKRLRRVARLSHSLAMADLVTRVYSRLLLKLICKVLVLRKKRLKRSIIQSAYLLSLQWVIVKV